MPWIGLDGSLRAAGFTTSLAPITSATSARRKFAVDLVHVAQLVVGHVGLGQQHVHVARHAAGDRMDGELHFAAAAFDQLGQLAHLVLGLGHGHAVAGNHDHVAGIGQLHGRVFDRNAADRFALHRLAGRRGRGRPPPKAPNSTLANERFMAWLIRIDRIKPLAPSSAPAMISTLFCKAKPVADEARPA